MAENKQNPDAHEQQNLTPQDQHDSVPLDGEIDTQILVPSGSARTGPNALVHGLYATDIVLPWESKEDFEQLWRDLQQEWLPQGRQENETVLSLAHMNWLKHRLMRTTQMTFLRDPLLSELRKQGIKTWAELSEFITKKATEEDTLRVAVLATVKTLEATLKDASKLLTSPNPQTADVHRQLEAFRKAFSEDRVRIYRKLYRDKPNAPDANKPGAKFSDLAEIDPTALMDQAYRPEYLAKLVQIESSIDARIDKILHRLMAMKEYKRIVRQTQIESPAIAPPDPK